MLSAHDVAAAVLAKTGGISAMKLQKLVYYCQAWHLARHRTPLFHEEIEAWREGPVVRSLYQRHRQLYRVTEWQHGDASKLSDQDRRTVSWVLSKYGFFSAERLSNMTHNEIPWRVARGALPADEPSESPISRDVMADYYARQRADVETAVSLAAASAALEGVELNTEWQERLREVASGSLNADALIADEIAHATGD